MKRSFSLVIFAVVALLLPVLLEAEISAECEAGIQAFESESPLQSELQRLLADFGTVVKKNNSCAANETAKGFDCNVTFAEDLSSYQKLCQARNGTVYQHSVLVDCSILFGTVQLNINLQEIPICVPNECDLSTLSPEDINVTALGDFKDSLRSGRCAVDGEKSTSPHINFWGLSFAVALLVTLSSLDFIQQQL
jgi:hypothetical protein